MENWSKVYTNFLLVVLYSVFYLLVAITAVKILHL